MTVLISLVESPAHNQPTQPSSSKRLLELSSNKATANDYLGKGGWDDPNCARPTRAFSSRALREHGDRSSHPASLFSILLGFDWEMGFEPIGDRCGHVVKIFRPSELVVSVRQEDQPLRTS